MVKFLFSVSVCLLRNFVFLPEMTRFLNLHPLIFPIAGRFSLMRKANWRRQNYQMPWRRPLQNTTVSYRQIPPRTKHDGPGKPQPNPKHFCSSIKRETLQEFWFPVPLTTYLKQHFDWLQRTLCFISGFIHKMFTTTPKEFILGHKRFILFFYCYFI